MKRFVSLIIAFVMLLSVCAMAEGKELIISNVAYSDSWGEDLDLSGIELKFAAAENNGKAGASVAVAANGEDVVRGVVSADEGGIYFTADGISDTYALPMETIEMMLSSYADVSGVSDAYAADAEANNAEELVVAIENLIAEGTAIMADCITPAGTEEIGGVEREVYDVNVSEEKMMQVVGLLDQILAQYPDALAGTGYNSVTEMFEAEGIELSMNGDVIIGNEEVIYELYLCESGEELINLYLAISTVYDAEEDLNVMDIYVALYDPAIENTDESEIGSALVSVDSDPVTDAFVMFDALIGDGSDDDIYFALNLGREGEVDVFKYFTISTMDDSEVFTVYWGEIEDVMNVIVEFGETEFGTSIEIAYAMPDDGKGSIEARLIESGYEYNLSADITVADSDGAWLPEIGETVDIMSLDEEQMDKLSVEAMGILGKLISACSAASEDFSTLIAEMM